MSFNVGDKIVIKDGVEWQTWNSNFVAWVKSLPEQHKTTFTVASIITDDIIFIETIGYEFASFKDITKVNSYYFELYVSKKNNDKFWEILRLSVGR